MALLVTSAAACAAAAQCNDPTLGAPKGNELSIFQTQKRRAPRFYAPQEKATKAIAALEPLTL